MEGIRRIDFDQYRLDMIGDNEVLIKKQRLDNRINFIKQNKFMVAPK